LETDTLKIRKALKTKNLIQKYVLGWMSAQGRTAQKKRTRVRAMKVNVFKIECCGIYGQLSTEKNKEKDLRIPTRNRKREALAKL
jgi:hypothetical protein